MSTKTTSPIVGETIAEGKKVITLGSNVTGDKLKKQKERDIKRALRNATNDAQKEAVKSARDSERTLSFQYKRLQKHAHNYCVSLSLETGKDVSFASIRALKFADFTPYITERETALFFGAWSFPRFLTIIKRYFRAECKNALSPKQIAELSALVSEINADVDAQ